VQCLQEVFAQKPQPWSSKVDYSSTTWAWDTSRTRTTMLAPFNHTSSMPTALGFNPYALPDPAATTLTPTDITTIPFSVLLGHPDVYKLWNKVEKLEEMLHNTTTRLFNLQDEYKQFMKNPPLHIPMGWGASSVPAHPYWSTQRCALNI
jgi:hypothetical protein